MENTEKQNPRKKLLATTLAVLFICLILAGLSIVNQFMGLNNSVEYERSVFISQIAEQMKKNLVTSKEHYLTNTRSYAAVLDAVQPETFAQVRSLFSDYAKSESDNRLFFLSSNCELYGIDGVKQWTSPPYEGYFIDVLS